MIQYPYLPDLSGKTIIVTGANSGLGYQFAKLTAEKGATVILACRKHKTGLDTIKKIQQYSPNSHCIFMALDLSDLNSIANFVESFTREFHTLDILCNNAGVMACPLSYTTQGFELQFGTNHLGHFALTRGLIQSLLKTKNSRVVNVSSAAHWIGKIDFNNLDAKQSYARFKAYAQSKLANVLFAYELDRRLKAISAECISVATAPGSVATNLQRYIAGKKISKFIHKMTKIHLIQSSELGVQSQLYAATATDVTGGKYYAPNSWLETHGAPKEKLSSKLSYDQDLAKKLWQTSEKLTKINFDLSNITL